MNIDIDSALKLWQFDILTSFNDRTQLVINKNTNQLMIKKVMGEEEFEIHQKLVGINHKNIIKVYDAIRDNHICTVLEQYVAGKTLEQLCHEKILSEKETENIILQVCCGLQILHENNIIHRDLTPSNIIISDDGIVKIIDFDIARAENDNSARDTRILGTEGFAAPEQFGFGQTNPQTDIYALGVLMNFMLTGGKLPYEEMYSGKMAAIIQKCIQIDREKRYKSVEETANCIKGKKSSNYSMIDKIFDNMPGLRNPKISVKAFSLLVYVLVFLFAYVCYYVFGKSISKVIYITEDLVLMFLLPFVFLSDFMSFQERIPFLKNMKKSNKKFIFGLLSVMCIILSIRMLPGMA